LKQESHDFSRVECQTSIYLSKQSALLSKTYQVSEYNIPVVCMKDLIQEPVIANREGSASFYRDAKPDLFMYQTAGRSFGGDRRHPNCEPMGKWIASVKAKSALPEHQQHFSYDELDKMAEKFSEICNAEQQSTSFLTPESGVWYGYSKNAEGEIEISRILHEMKG
jgi:hypothetical protein